jgi:predicted DNA binding CopG/RHH family protein
MTAELRDPFDSMTDEDIDRFVADLTPRPRMRSLNIKAPADLIERTKAVADARGVHYQTLIKALWEAGLRRLERPRG